MRLNLNDVKLKENQWFVRLVKVKDNKFEGKHPNGIFEGYTKEGIADRLPCIGQSFIVHDPATGRSLWTSTVTAVRESEFDTENSTYKYAILRDGNHEANNG